ncbi:MAG: hypothetical protein O2887_14820 [Bacteroidetes bacterium]|nr:hypothetical protein [Bacteroidota bacterium]MDA1121740.1 hypothetical protein [Bacteroidota bacterium]
MSKSKLLAEKACVEAKAKLEKLGIEVKLQQELDWVIGSYNYDKNPVGLIEVGNKALGVLKKYQAEKPRLVSKKFVEDLEKAFSKK